MAVEGDLKDMDLTSLVQMACLNQRKAALVLRRHRGEEGVIFFEGGEIVHAMVGSLVGAEAVYHLLNWTDGTFRMRDHVRSPRRTVDVPWHHLLLEGLKQIDEQEAKNAAQAQSQKPLSPAEVKQDRALENDLILLLSRLEHLRARLAGRKSQKRPALALQILVEMVNHAAAFSEEHLDVEADVGSLAEALDVAGDLYPRARLLQAQDNRLSARTMSNLYNSWAGDSAGRRQTFHQVVWGMIDVLQTYFSHFTARFQSASVAGQWRETCNIFLADLTQVVDNVRF